MYYSQNWVTSLKKTKKNSWKQEINAFFRFQSRYFADFCLHFANFCFNFRFFHGWNKKNCKKTRFWELLLPKSRLFTQQLLFSMLKVFYFNYPFLVPITCLHLHIVFFYCGTQYMKPVPTPTPTHPPPNISNWVR